MSGEITVSGPDDEKRIEWKIPHIFKIRSTNSISSPSIRIFENGIFLRVSPNVKNSLFMDIYNYSVCDLNIEYIMGIKCIDGSELKTEKHELILSQTSRTPPQKLVSRNDLLSSKDFMAPGDCLTVFCNIRFIEMMHSDVKILTSNPSSHDIESKKSVDLRSSNVSSGEEKGAATSGDSGVGEAISVLIQNFKDLYLKKTFTDITIKVKNNEFSAHKNILASRSEVFASMFQHDMSEKRSGIVEIDDCDPESFEDFLLFLYAADVKIVSSKNAASLYKTSDKYGCKELLKECKQCMIRELSVDTFCDCFYLAIMHNDSDLLEASTNFFMRNAKSIFPTKKWITLLEEHASLCNELLIKLSNSVK